VLATIALKARKAIHERNVGIVRKNIAVGQPFFDAHRELFYFTPPDGGCVCFVKYKGAGRCSPLAVRR
jgi:hypothetical protein